MSENIPKGWKKVKLNDVSIINPKETLSKKTRAKKVAMEALEPFTKKIHSFSIEELNVGSTQPLIRQTDLKKLELIMPDKETVNRFHENTERFFSKIRQNKQQIRTLEQLRDALLPKLINGKVRVKE